MMTFDDAHRLIKKGDILALQQALDDGLDPNASHQHGWTLLMHIATTGHVKLGELFIVKGADVHKIQDGGWTAFSLAAAAGHLLFINLLLAHGASTQCQIGGISFEKWLAHSDLPADKKAAILDIMNR